MYKNVRVGEGEKKKERSRQKNEEFNGKYILYTWIMGIVKLIEFLNYLQGVHCVAGKVNKLNISAA